MGCSLKRDDEILALHEEDLMKYKSFNENTYNDRNELTVWLIIFGGSCGMFLLGREWSLMTNYELWQWTFFSFAVLFPIVVFAFKLIGFKKARISVPLMLFGVFLCVCMDPLKYYWMGGRIRSPRGFPEPSHEAFSDVGFLVSLFCFMALLVITLKPGKKKSALKTIKGPQTIKQVLISAVVLFVIGLIPFLLLGGDSVSLSSITEAVSRGRSGGGLQFETTNSASSTAHILVLANATVVSGVLAGYGLIAFSGKRNTKVFLFVLFIASLLFVASGGGRTRVGFVLFPLIILLYLKLINLKQNKYIWLVGCFVVFTLILMIIQLRYRDQGWQQIGQDYNVSQSGYSNDLCTELAVIVSHYPEQEYFLGGDNIFERTVYPIPKFLYFFVANPIPRILWSGKPESPSWAKYNYLRTGSTAEDQGSTVTATVMGRFYMEYGIPGVIEIGLLMGFLWRLVDKAIINHEWNSFAVLISCMFSYYLLQSTRDLWPGWLYPVLFLILYGIGIDIYNRKHGRCYIY